jgi:S-adenosylmethionine:tRNA ribosyltransferase-isomerase
MIPPKEIAINDYTYQLPDDKIALYPKEERDASKLLIYKENIISEDIYKNIADHLPENSLLVFNNTKVIRARIRFQRSSGGTIEIFCLEPYEAINEYSTIMNKKGSVRWKCMIGGVSKWKENELIKELFAINCELKARLTEKLSDAYVVEFSWQPEQLSFAEVIAAAGDIPLPPYIKRTTEITDTERYQTVYAHHEGSVAAPTAGLHFTPAVFDALAKKNIQKAFVTLHVGAGTFKPVKAAVMEQHEMHAEWIDVGIDTIENILASIHNNIIAVGTTSLRTLESLYWMGVKSSFNSQNLQLKIGQWDVYEAPLANTTLSAEGALTALIKWMKENNMERLFTQTQILIVPGYRFKIVKGIITNFHQPQSTLLLLVAAAVGDSWKKIYDHALQNDFRFLSYGDGSLLFIK